MKNESVRCDYCETDLTTTGNSIDWRLVLRNEPIPIRGGAVTDMYIPPALKSDAHFCGTRCLKEWVSAAL